MNQILAGSQETPLFHRHITSYLYHPRLMGMRGHPRDMHLPAAQMDEKKHVVRHEATQRPDLSGKEIGGYHHLQVYADELPPCGSLLPLWRWGKAMAFQNVA